MIQKTTLEEKNKAMADLYLTLKPKTFEAIVQALIQLRDADKEGFDRVLEQFDENKRWVPPRHTLIDIYRKKYIDKDALNNLLSITGVLGENGRQPRPQYIVYYRLRPSP